MNQYIKDVYDPDAVEVVLSGQTYRVLVKGDEATVRSPTYYTTFFPDVVKFRKDAELAAEQVSGCLAADTYQPLGYQNAVYQITLDC